MAAMVCNEDGCSVGDALEKVDPKFLKGLPDETRRKLANLVWMDPIDYDAYGTRVRESGV